MRLSQLHPNEGQIKGVPNNPRKISEEEFKKLKRSIYESREFLVARPFIVDEEWNILGGNMRYRACCELRDEKAVNGSFRFEDEIPDEWVKQVFWPRKKKREFVQKDNQSSGETDIELLAAWDAAELASWGITADDLAPDVDVEDLGCEKAFVHFETVKEKRKQLWGKEWKREAATNLKEYPLIHYLDGAGYMTIYRRTEDGIRFTDLKAESNREYVEVFAQSALKLLKATCIIGDPSDFCIITTPRRRHADGYHFATEICKRLSDLTSIRFEPDVVASKNHKRLDPTFYRLKTPPERNLILYDDIITTGSTLLATRELFPEKNIITIVNVCNRGATM